MVAVVVAVAVWVAVAVAVAVVVWVVVVVVVVVAVAVDVAVAVVVWAAEMNLYAINTRSGRRFVLSAATADIAISRLWTEYGEKPLTIERL